MRVPLGTSRCGAAVMKARRVKARTPSERDLMEVLAHSERTAEEVADAVVTVLSRADAPTLAALGRIFEFVALWAPRRRR
jgi:hypothetical protein